MLKKTLSYDFSYLSLSLRSFLKESHPTLLNDVDFINARTEAAAEAYSNAIINGFSHDSAEELASNVLFSGLLFSKVDTVTEVLRGEFFDTVDEKDIRLLACRLTPLLEHVFCEYDLTDHFASSAEYELLYTELTGAIDGIISNKEFKC